MYHRYRNNVFVIMILFIILICCSPTLAGEGDGSGGGSSDPLVMVSSNPASGQQGVELPSVIQLVFNKNVINMAVADHNRSCFILNTSDGQTVPIQVIMADDQVQPELKRQITIKPLTPLSPGKEYTLHINPDLQAKSGAVLAGAVEVKFTTAGETGDTGTSSAAPAVRDDQDKTSGRVPLSAEKTVAENLTEPTPNPVGNVSGAGINSTAMDSVTSELDNTPPPARINKYRPITIVLIIMAGLVMLAGGWRLIQSRKMNQH